MKKLVKVLLVAILIFLFVISIPELIYTNSWISKSIGTRSNGKLENAYLFPYTGTNYKYFSFISYYFLNNAYSNSRVYNTVIDAYKSLEETCPDNTFYIMECSDKHGGKLALHKTHQNGMSIDFMIPKKKNWIQYNNIGLLHYLLEFDHSGKLNFHKTVEIDYETMAKHILALDKAGKKHGLKIKMVILKIELKDDFYKTKSGKLVKEKGIYFAQSLGHWTNKMHDDHYHIDFEFR